MRHATPPTLRAAAAGRRGVAGFSLLELLATLFVMSIVLIGILGFFDLSNRLSRTQLTIAEMQTTQRIVHQRVVSMTTMAGIGGLPVGIDPADSLGNTNGVFPNGLAMAIDNNVGAGVKIAGTSGFEVLPGTDVLTLRGVYSTEVMFIEPEQELKISGTGGEATFTLGDYVDVGVTQQSIDDLRDALQASNGPEAIIFYDRFNPDAYAVFEYVPSKSVLGSAGGPLTITVSLANGTTHGTDYARLILGTPLIANSGGETWTIGGFSVNLPRNVGAVGLLEEYKIFILDRRKSPLDPADPLYEPVLAMARLYPGTTTLHPTMGVANPAPIELADNIIDLQVALGVDSVAVDGVITENDSGADEVLYNHPDDDDFLGAGGVGLWNNPNSELLFTRVTTVAQTDQPDRNFPGALLTRVEDHDYSTSPFNSGTYYLKLRKRVVTTTVEMRNLP